MAVSTAAASARVRTRTSMLARTSGAITLERNPPSMVPTFTVMPREASLSAKSFWIW